MTNHDRGQSASGLDTDFTLDVRTLRARVESEDGVPSLLLSDGAVTIKISTDRAGPTVRDLIPIGRLVASALRFQTVCNRFTRSPRRLAQTMPPGQGPPDEGS
jgi:hypothetical protein